MIELKKLGEIDCSVIYTTIPELVKDTGVSKSAIHRHLRTDTFDAFQVNHGGKKYRIFIHPDEAAKFKKLVKAGIIGWVDQEIDR